MERRASRDDAPGAHGRRAHPVGWIRGLGAWVLVGLGPALCWVVWASWNDSDVSSVGWFLTWGLAVVLAGWLAPRGALWVLGLAVVSVGCAAETLWLWWSSRDSSGLFLVGLMIAVPLLALSAPLLLLMGQHLPQPRLSRLLRGRGTRRRG